MRYVWSTLRPGPPQEGQGLAEYALILALVAIVVIVALQFLGQNVRTMMSDVGKLGLMNRRRRLGARGGRAQGQTVVELALLLPVLMLIMGSAIDGGRVFFTWIQVHNAAREAAAYGAANPTDNAGIVRAAAGEKDAQAQGGENAISVATSCADNNGAAISCAVAAGGSGRGNTMTVSVSERFSFVMPLIGAVFGNGFTLGAKATAAVLGAASAGSSNPGQCPPPTSAAFSVVQAGLTITLDASAAKPDTGTCAISGYNWDYGDGTVDVNKVGVSHSYAGAGTYVVMLEVTNQGGAKTTSQTLVVTPSACAAPTASFGYSQQNKTKPVDFDASASGPASGTCAITGYSWDFGDGSQGTGKTVSHNYNKQKTIFTATLTVTNAGGVTTQQQQLTTK